jgi:catechol 2,3-dioxygenase-like lactoylglutathione lyase family enzyme
MRIYVTSVLVDDQDKALTFYTDVLEFVKKTEIPLAAARGLTVVSAEDPQGPELLLEPDGHPAVGPFKRALLAEGIPYQSFAVSDVQGEYDRLRAAGVRFTQEPLTQEPLELGDVTTAVFDDTCGNLIQLVTLTARSTK